MRPLSANVDGYWTVALCGQNPNATAIETTEAMETIERASATNGQQSPGNQSPPELTRFETGAVRSTDASDVRFDLIPPDFLIRLAKVYAGEALYGDVSDLRIDLIPMDFLEGLGRLYAEGAKKYGEYNWQKGIPVEDLLNHGLRHVVLWMNGDRSEDHLLHAVWNFLTAWLFLDRPELLGRFAVDGDGDGKGGEKGVSSGQ